ncbi:hypothetical protein ACFQI7_11680 [Paenibacillus allorhizosphaerae]|uniref:DUF3829 domain-containing protein n=1 Tax=Paenibacillus allorhizosphaerae TaxID=2849866 RepID=A0ABN7TMP7_9BACL|nr:hypothetical protein [Paenibacillus allorhizosphaerae]CAG7641513.1 hypothetical protein PAECIP111802_02750 [Paenibacillus allorhizosphaerae]
MEKRLNRTDYLFAATFIFMLVVALGAFFFGLRMGQDRAAVKYEDLIVKQNDAAKGFTAYHQQYLVSFYHTIYAPYREFHKKWFDKMDELQSNRSSDASLIMKDLSKLANDNYSALGTKSMPDSSPLLQDAHKNYMKSLKLFSEALRGYTTKANAVTGPDLAGQLNGDAYLTEAKSFALTAEKQYYDAIVKWNESVNPQLKAIDSSKSLALKDWSELAFNMKNDYVAQQLSSGKTYAAFTPQDLTSRIDEMIVTGQAKKLNLNDVKQVIDLLIGTDAVRSGDFLRYKNRLYANETLPELPFFTN